jgi:hypothetical protein
MTRPKCPRCLCLLSSRGVCLNDRCPNYQKAPS